MPFVTSQRTQITDLPGLAAQRRWLAPSPRSRKFPASACQSTSCAARGENRSRTPHTAPSQLDNFFCLHERGETCKVPNYQRCDDDAAAARIKTVHSDKENPQATQSSHFISWLVYLSLAMTPCTLLFILLFFFFFKLAIVGDAFFFSEL